MARSFLAIFSKVKILEWSFWNLKSASLAGYLGGDSSKVIEFTGLSSA